MCLNAPVGERDQALFLLLCSRKLKGNRRRSQREGWILRVILSERKHPKGRHRSRLPRHIGVFPTSVEEFWGKKFLTKTLRRSLCLDLLWPPLHRSQYLDQISRILYMAWRPVDSMEVTVNQ
jgi:hypothetical protein